MGEGREAYVNLLQGIPYLEERTPSGLQPRYWDETEEIDTDLQKFVSDVTRCAEH